MTLQLRLILLIVAALAGFCASETVLKPYTCTFPFQYKGQEYNECVKFDSSAWWCSVYAIYNGTFSYCKSTDEITKDHFIDLIERAEKNNKRLIALKTNATNVESTCSECLEKLRKISGTVRELSAIYMDQNKRLQGLKSQHQKLDVVINELKKYYQMRRCRSTDQGGDYLGRLSKTVGGYTCQDWTSQSPQKHPMTDGPQFSDNSVKLASHYCRNPNHNEKPWCYTTNPKVRFDYCHVPVCNEDCKVDENDKSSLPLCAEFQSSSCPAGSVFYNNRCYMRVSSPMDFYSAEKYCVARKGHLSSVHSIAENLFLAKTLMKNYKTSFWIGLQDSKSEGRFKWTDGTVAKYRRFYSGEPNNAGNEDCVETGRYQGVREAWNDISCSARRAFVCKFEL